MLDGLWITYQVTVSSIIGALSLGLITGLSRRSPDRWLRMMTALYVEIIRGIPLLVQLFYIYYALGRFVQVPDIVAAVLTISVCYGGLYG